MQAQRARLAHRLFFPPHDQAMALRFYAARIRADATDLIARSKDQLARSRDALARVPPEVRQQAFGLETFQDNDGSRRD